MPFGLCDAAATFQQLTQTAMCGLLLKHYIIYLDSILALWERYRAAQLRPPISTGSPWEAGPTLNPKECRLPENKWFRQDLYKLTEKVTRKKVIWGMAHAKVFPELNFTLCGTDLGPTHFDAEAAPFVLGTDASNVVVGGVSPRK
ncbi:unnamed protein product [Hydatigera taeniaeformis]|uniref:RT_RNaseH_2 domain-containing protein n=1 Tax=Hydatigena taeniaeformis TaxID=6205 RepID=A0A0R3WV00_HYDTA|nr:unnamed protein product [Hydatigera taeniaeformis]